MAYVSVSGTVTRTFYNGKGAEITESFEIKGKEIKKRWTAWFESEHGLSEGDVVEASGLHGDEVDEWEKDGQTRHSVKRSINRAKVKDGASAAAGGRQARQEPLQASGDGWADSTPQAGAYGSDDLVPF